MEKLTGRISVPLDPSLLAELRAAAEAERLPVASEARRLIVMGLAAKRGASTPAAEVTP